MVNNSVQNSVNYFNIMLSECYQFNQTSFEKMKKNSIFKH